MTPGARLVRTLTTPLLEPCWFDDIFDWDLLDHVYDQLSSGEQAVVDLAQSLDGQGSCNIGQCLAAVDGPTRDMFVMQVAVHADRLVR